MYTSFFLYLSLFTFFLNIQASSVQIEPSECISISSFETADCFISFVESSGEKFVVKQIKDPSPDEQFLLVLDVLGCHIAEKSNIPMNKVTIISPNSEFPGKKRVEFPATLHTMAIGVSTDQECPYQDIDIHQRFRKENTLMWHRWGSLTPERTGLTLTVIKNMARHSNLPMIAALDTFVGNADRSHPNLFYDAIADRFCGIDMAASFSSPLASAACRQIRGLEKEQLTHEEQLALESYSSILELLIKNWPPEKQESLLLEYGKIAGFEKGSSLFDQNITERIEFHIRCIRTNYEHSIELVKMIRKMNG